MEILEIQKVDLTSFCYLNKGRYPFLLESVNHNENNRYSILFAFPGDNIVLKNFSDFDFLSGVVQAKEVNFTSCNVTSIAFLKD